MPMPIETTHIRIRSEEKDDYSQIDEVLLQAFERKEEATLVHQLRKNGGYIALVALEGDKVVGHVFFSPTPIQTENGLTDALSLAPVAVRPQNQRQGVGALLIEKGLKRCKKDGHRVIIILGHPEYYPRFGFVTASSKGIKPPFTVPDEAFMIIELQEGALKGAEGVVSYPPEFEGV
ncbi:MAG: N-acetyltransferase [Methanobacteriaceae archaeon]|nr:N-acetyltransferase [Methanobacteriaceae archaeon]